MKKAKVLLISPNIVGSKNGINRLYPGMGIACLASQLRKAGHQVIVRDTALEGWKNEKPLENNENSIIIGESDDQIAEYVRSVDPDIVGISFIFSSSLDSVKNTAKIVKSVNPKIPVVIGGNHVTNVVKDYYYALDNKLQDSLFEYFFRSDICDENIDYAVLGEGDFVFVELVERLINKQDVTGINNLILPPLSLHLILLWRRLLIFLTCQFRLGICLT